MQHFRSLEHVHLENAWLTIGAFDGVHIGHQEIVRELTAAAHAVGAPAVVLTFDPHPAAILRPERKLRYLTSPQQKAELLGALGVDVVITHPFNRQVASLSALEFLLLLKKHLGFSQFWVGYDFAMGRNREGDIPTLTRLGAELGYVLKVFSPIKREGQVVSSSQVRRLLREGDVQGAAELLGRPYRIGGEVIMGAQRGRTLGIPTANLDIPEECLVPQRGVYVCLAQVNSETWGAVTNIGVRPTFDGVEEMPSVEAHLLDFHDDVYGEVIYLDFLTRLRSERRFPSVQALIDQIQTDITQARSLLAVRAS